MACTVAEAAVAAVADTGAWAGTAPLGHCKAVDSGKILKSDLIRLHHNYSRDSLDRKIT